MIAGITGLSIFRWLGTHIMPWAAMFLAGAWWADNRAEIKDLREDVRTLEAEKAAAAVEIAASGRMAEKAAADERAAQTALLDERERFYATISKTRAPVGACPANRADGDRMRDKTAAAYRFAVGALPSGVNGGEGEESRPGRDAAPPD